jgi:general secretion pathway protein A
MYERFYGFCARPFDLTPNPRYLVPTEGQAEAISNIEYALASRKGITLLVGQPGVGKTTVIRAAIAKQSERTHCVHLHNPALSRVEFVEMLAAQMGLSPHARSSKTALLLEFEQLLRRRYDAQRITALIVDEAQGLSSELLEEVRLLANIETSSDKLLSIVLAGQPEIANRLNHPSFRPLKQRIALRCELHPLRLPETFAYLVDLIKAAGAVPADVFTREAVELIHDRSCGIPRTINVIADNALIAGLATRQRPASARTVAEVCRDFDITTGGTLQCKPPSENAAWPSVTTEEGGEPIRTTAAAISAASNAPNTTTPATLFNVFSWKSRRLMFR